MFRLELESEQSHRLEENLSCNLYVCPFQRFYRFLQFTWFTCSIVVILKSTVNLVLYDDTQTQPFWVQFVLALIPAVQRQIRFLFIVLLVDN